MKSEKKKTKVEKKDTTKKKELKEKKVKAPKVKETKVKEKKVKEKKVKEPKQKKDSFFKHVIAELKITEWPDKKYMVKYSIATFVVIISCSIYFYLFYLLFTFIKELR